MLRFDNSIVSQKPYQKQLRIFIDARFIIEEPFIELLLKKLNFKTAAKRFAKIDMNDHRNINKAFVKSHLDYGD